MEGGQGAQNPHAQNHFAYPTLTALPALQGEVGDCWFLAGLSLLARFHDHMMRLVCTRQNEELGVYEFTFKPEGREIKVCVDGRVPVVTGDKGARPAYCHSRTEGELWPILLEKAYAKLYGGYQDISGGLQVWCTSCPLTPEAFLPVV